jgi:hypothetical protein
MALIAASLLLADAQSVLRNVLALASRSDQGRREMLEGEGD